MADKETIDLTGPMKVDLMADPEQTMLDIINRHNPVMLKGPVTKANVTIGHPQLLSNFNAEGPNSRLNVSSVRGVDYKGDVEVFYNRVNIADYVTTMVGDSTPKAYFDREKTNTIKDVIDYLNVIFGTRINPHEIADTSEVIDLRKGAVAIKAKPSSLLFYGDFIVKVSPDISKPLMAKINTVDVDNRKLYIHLGGISSKVEIVWGDGEIYSRRGIKSNELIEHTYSVLSPSINFSIKTARGDNIQLVIAGGALEEIRDFGVLPDVKSIKFSHGGITAPNLVSVPNELPVYINDISKMFYKARSFNSNINDWDLTPFDSLKSVFEGASSFNQPLDKWLPRHADSGTGTFIKNIANLFYGAESFNQDISSWDMSKVTDATNMFRDAVSFQSDISDWDISSLVTMSYMFFNARSLNSDISKWDTGSVKKMNHLFFNLVDYNPAINNWNVSSVIDMSWMFYNNQSFDHDITGWNVSSVRKMRHMFQNTSLFNLDIGIWDTANLTDTSFMFQNSFSFNQDISTWDMSKVSYMKGMFSNTQDFNQDLSAWDVSNVVDTSYMFENAKTFNQSLNSWNVSNVKTMDNMFANTEVFNAKLNQWNTGNVTSMSHMFDGARVFNQAIGDWDVRRVTDFSYTFNYAVDFNQDIGQWRTLRCVTMEGMFLNAVDFNQDIGDWFTRKVTNMNYMFQSAVAFNQDLSLWHVPLIQIEPIAFDYYSGFEGEEAKQPDWGRINPV